HSFDRGDSMRRAFLVLISICVVSLLIPVTAAAQGYDDDGYRDRDRRYDRDDRRRRDTRRDDRRRDDYRDRDRDRRDRRGDDRRYDDRYDRGPAPMSRFGEQHKIMVGPLFGLGGEFEGELENKVTGGTAEMDEDMLSTLGGFLHFEAPLHRHFVLGGRAAMGAFTAETQDDNDWSRDLLFNFNAVPKLRYPFNAPGEVYVGVPVGMSLIMPSDDWEDEIGVDAEMGINWNMSVVGGFNYLMFGEFGLFGEAGWMLQNVGWDGDDPAGDKVELDASFSQFGINFGVVVPL
ncbi:MAG: hypothetical protein ACLFVJ_10170, partial [Persicimonas sp.]